MNIDKLVQVVYYIIARIGINNTINYTKLIKLLYLSDRKSIENRDFPIEEIRMCL